MVSFGVYLIRKNIKGYLHITKTVNDNLIQLVNRTLNCKAAIRRIVNSMPESNGGREALQDFLK